MNRNVEIKARAADWDRQLEKAGRLAPLAEELVQEDVFFNCGEGRLKLRRLGTGEAQLIYYDRPDQAGPKTSFYDVAPVQDPAALRRVLSLALGETARVEKRRKVFIFEGTRIHFDEVEGLGRFIELEAVLDPGESEESGNARAAAVMGYLGIRREHLLEGAYADHRSATHAAG